MVEKYKKKVVGVPKSRPFPTKFKKKRYTRNAQQTFKNSHSSKKKRSNKSYQEFMYQKYLSYQMLVQKSKPKKKISGPFEYLSEKAKKLRTGPLRNLFFPYKFSPIIRKHIREQSIRDFYFTTPEYICLKVLNLITKKGKKRTAYGIFTKVIYGLKKKKIQFPRQLICKVILSLRPLVSLRKKVVSGVVKKFPSSISVQSSVSIALHWFIKSVRLRPERSMTEKLIAECLDLYSKRSCLSKKKQQEFYKQVYQSRYLLRRPSSTFTIPKSFLIPDQPFIPNFYSPRFKSFNKYAKKKKKNLSHNEIFYSLTVSKLTSAGRNNSGRITCYHRGGGFKRRFRFIDFQNFLINVPGFVIRYEPDPNRRSYLVLIFFANGFFSYRICPSNLMLGSCINAGSKVSNMSIGNSLFLSLITQGSKVFNVQFSQFSKSFFSRSAGSNCLLLTKSLKTDFVVLRLPSSEHRIVHSNCFATLGVVSNFFQKFSYFQSAGKIRNLGKRPMVRGTAMNPVDHPHGGGAGKTAGGRPSVTPWSVITKGKPTRRQKINKWVVQSRSFYKLRKL